MRPDQKLKIAFLTRYDKSRGSSRFRVYSYIPHLERIGWQCRIIPFPAQISMKTKTGFLQKAMSAAFRADVVVLQKLVLREGLIALLKRVNKNIVFDFDDAIYTPADSLVDDPKARKRYKIIEKRLHHTLREVRSIIAGNGYLARYAAQFNSSVHVLPTSLDIDHYTIKETAPGKKPIVLGWIGSRENLLDFQPVKDAIKKTLKKTGDAAVLKIVSSQSLSLGETPVRFEPWSLEKEKEHLYSFDIGLMPLKDTERTRGRCAFKAILYMAAGLPVLASPVGAASEVVEHGKTGILAATPSEWVAGIERLVQDPQLRSDLGSAGHGIVKEKYSIQANATKLSDILKTAISS